MPRSAKRKAKYVAFLDSDDLWLPRKLEIQIASLRRHAARKWSYTGLLWWIDPASDSPAATVAAGPVRMILEDLLMGRPSIALPSVVGFPDS